VLFLRILKERFILILQLVPFGGRVVIAWVGTLLIRWARDKA
jgi:hypothetical protein